MSLTWYPPGQSVQFGDIKLLGGMFYSSSKQASWPGEPSAILSTASVGKYADPPDQDLGYYPSYEYLSPSQRRTYLEWLAAGKRDADPSRRSLGYLFLFFYGLERRILLDKDRDSALIDELLALLTQYSPHHKSRSLRGYFSSLGHYGARLMSEQHYRHYWPSFFALDDGKTGEEVMKLVLANLFELNEPLHWSIAYRLAMADQACRKSVVITRAKQEFWYLFQSRYEGEHGAGLKLQAARQAGCFRYQPASAALLRGTSYDKPGTYEIKVPNVSGMHSQFQRVFEIWNSCVDDLSGYSRMVSSKKQTDSVGLKAWLALPDELQKVGSSPMQPFWDWMMAAAPSEDGVYFVRAGYLAPWFGISERTKLTSVQSTDIVHAVASMGWTIAPYPGHVDLPFAWEQELAVYRRDGTAPVEPQIPGIVRLLYLVMPIAAADGTIEPEELEAFHRLVRHEVTKDADWRYLLAVEAALMRDANVALKALPAMTRHFTAKNRDSVFHLLVHIAAADGDVAPEEIKVLKKIARGLELPPDAAERLLKEDLAFREVTVAEAQPGKRAGEAIPAKADVPRTSLRLNMDRIAALTQETHEVVSMLSQVMTDEDPVVQTPAKAEVMPATMVPEWAAGIAHRYQSALVSLVAHDEVDADRFASLAAEHHLMHDDLFNTVNAWADEVLGDFLLERGDPIRIYRELLSTHLAS